MHLQRYDLQELAAASAGAPLRTVVEVQAELDSHLKEARRHGSSGMKASLRAITCVWGALASEARSNARFAHQIPQVKALGDERGLQYLDAGFQPKWAVADVPAMPKVRRVATASCVAAGPGSSTGAATLVYRPSHTSL